MPKHTRAQGLLAAGFGLALIACTDATIHSDLNSEGAPRVVAVAVLSEGAGGEAATFCSEAEGDKRNIYICPEGEATTPVTDAAPVGWYVRVVFNELLDPDTAEDIVDGRGTLAETQPVTLTCNGQPVAYDGYYYPSGSHLTDPAGPALVVEPLLPDAFVASGTLDCEISVKAEVTDKEGNAMTQVGPYLFGIAPFSVALDADGDLNIEPPACATGVALDADVTIEFNAYLDIATAEGNVALVDVATETEVPVTFSAAAEESSTGLVLTPTAPLAADTTYAIRVSSGVADIAGGAFTRDEPLEVLFSTGATVAGEACAQ